LTATATSAATGVGRRIIAGDCGGWDQSDAANKRCAQERDSQSQFHDIPTEKALSIEQPIIASACNAGNRRWRLKLGMNKLNERYATIF
jgi:hypothetical protein